MPDSLELPGVLRAVIPLMSGERLARLGRCVVNKFVAFTFGPATLIRGQAATGHLPCFAAVTRALDDLSEPTAGLRCIDAIRIGWRSLHMVDFPAGKVRTTDVPLFALAV